MEKNIPIHLQEIIFSSSDSATSQQISKLEKEGTIRKLANRVYTSNLVDSPEDITRRNLFHILGHLYPGALLSHRSAFEFAPTSSGQIFLTYSYTRKAQLPGITVRLLAGHKPIKGDTVFSGELHLSQRERALLENMESSRKPGPDSKVLTFPEIEEKLEQIIRVNGEDELNNVRDRARKIAKDIGLTKEFTKLNKIISALLTTKPSRILKSPVATARAFGVPYDPVRIQRFELLFTALKQQEFQHREEKNTTTAAYRNFAFYESYFSNYIEGTVFEIEEAKRVIETQKPLPARNEDSHDVLGTYQIVSNPTEMKIVPATKEELVDILQYRHQILLSARKDKKPGKFKDKNNRAGDTSFVAMELVTGTLYKSFDYYQALKHPFAKAAYIMFVISEVHPFLDGNGRIARVMMNAELSTASQTKIIIPTVYREDYLGGLRKLTRNQDPSVYIRMLNRAQAFSDKLLGDDMVAMEDVLQQSNAFKESNEGVLKIIN
ncbi:Fic family protein [Winogradskyella forsetii]|uniref:Fic family protein n=1 Tax=Winogradskyella forsetii TaxID=2686077 RepID=UPI0015C0189D|nr:Fic family protein [Winogradskyella forsetii]